MTKTLPLRISALLLFLGAGYFSTSCKKEQATQTRHFNGVVLHSIDKTPLANQTVTLTTYTISKFSAPTPEYPNGEPQFSNHKFETKSDQDGRFSLNASFPEGEWSYYITAHSDFYLTTQSVQTFFPVRDYENNTNPHTILMEKPAYITYNINTMGANFENESLRIRTPYQKKWMIGNSNQNNGQYYNLVFYGKTILSIKDTIPGQSITDLEVEWIHLLTDTIQYKKDIIKVDPYKNTIYTINY